MAHINGANSRGNLLAARKLAPGLGVAPLVASMSMVPSFSVDVVYLAVDRVDDREMRVRVDCCVG